MSSKPERVGRPSCSWVVNRAALKRLGGLALVLCCLVTGSYVTMIRMPGKSHRGPLPSLTEAQSAMAEHLAHHVRVLATEIGSRNVARATRLAATESYLSQTLAEMGFEVQRQEFSVDGVTCANLWVEIPGTDQGEGIVVVGAHYDTCGPSPGANDNGSGVAATLVLADRFHGLPLARTVRFVLFVNEEPPYFTTSDMGSVRYARRCRARDENIVAMLSLETIGYYRDDRGSQKYPPPLGLLYPATGDFIAFVGNIGSRRLVRKCVETFRGAAAFPCEGGAPPGWIPGVGWSDHWSFWKAGYEAVMVTDTAPFRYPHYHELTDTPDKLDYERMARVVAGLEEVLRTLAKNE